MKKNVILNMFVLMALSPALLGQEDIINGHKTDYYPNGKRMREYDVTDGVPQGSYKFYNENGVLILDQYLTDGFPNGYYRTYFDNGQLQFEGFMKDGQFDGPSKEYYRNGTIKRNSNVTGPALSASGTITDYNEDGIVVSITNLANGKPVMVKTYFADGRPKGEQSEGKMVSYWYDFDGNKHTSINGVEQE
jgi:uncharacterized protein